MFAQQLKRIVKSDGTFVLADIFLKNISLTRLPVLLYIKYAVPVINFIFTQRNPHRHLYSFASKSFNLELLCQQLEQENMSISIKSIGLKQGVILYGKNL